MSKSRKQMFHDSSWRGIMIPLGDHDGTIPLGDHDGTAVTAVQRAHISAGNDDHIDHGDHGGHCGPCCGSGRFADAGRPCAARRSQLARLTASRAGPSDRRRSAGGGGRLPAGRSSPVLPAAAQRLARRSAAACWPVIRLRWPAGMPDSARRTRRSAAGGRRGSKRSSLLIA